MIILKREIIHDRGGEVGINNNNIQQTTIKDIPSRAPKSFLKPVIFFLFIFFSHNIFVTIKSTESVNEFFFSVELDKHNFQFRSFRFLFSVAEPIPDLLGSSNWIHAVYRKYDVHWSIRKKRRELRRKSSKFETIFCELSPANCQLCCESSSEMDYVSANSQLLFFHLNRNC